MELLLTVISTSAVFEPYKDCASAGVLLVEWSNGSLSEYKVEFDPFCDGRYLARSDRNWKSLTKEEVVTSVGEGNYLARSERAALHHKVRTQQLGWDYQKRGYK